VKTTNPFDLVLFGATGDLAMSKLLPALYRRDRAGQLPADGRIIATARRALDRASFIERIDEAFDRHLEPDERTAADWDRFVARLDFVSVDADTEAGFDAMAAVLSGREDHNRVFYLAVAPAYFVDICQTLHRHGLVTDRARVVLEKPLGHDLASAQAISEQIGAIFAEDAIYRIDHYLGKETVQNLIALRFGNMLFEPLWRREWVRDVQISVSEQLGVGGRADFYDRTGALRDMVQNHMLQLLCIIAMEPPTDIGADAVRDEKLKVLRALKRLEGQDVLRNTCAGSTAPAPLPVSRCRAISTRTGCRRTAAPRPSSRCAPSCRTGAGRACRFTCAPASDCRSVAPRLS